MQQQDNIYSIMMPLFSKMELDPVAFLEEMQDAPREHNQYGFSCELVCAWARMLCFQPEETLKICDTCLPMLNKPNRIGLFTDFLLIKSSALSMLMRLAEMKSTLEEAQIAAQPSHHIYPGTAINLSLASYYFRAQEVSKAEYLTMKSVGLLDRVGEPYLKVDLLWRLATLYNFLRKYSVAIGYFVQCFQLCNKYRFKLRALQTSVELVALNSNLGYFTRAEKFYNYGIKLAEQLRIPAYQIGLSFNYGLLYKLQGKLP